jgi:hypothetical protein
MQACPYLDPIPKDLGHLRLNLPLRICQLLSPQFESVPTIGLELLDGLALPLEFLPTNLLPYANIFLLLDYQYILSLCGDRKFIPSPPPLPHHLPPKFFDRVLEHGPRAAR